MNIQTLYPIFKTIHVASMSTAVTALIVGELLLLLGGYLQAAPTLYRGSKLLSHVSEKLGLIGLLAGAGTALTGGWGLFRPWLILAYLLIVLTFILGKWFVLPWKSRVDAVMTNPNGIVVGDLQHLLRERRAVLGRWLVVAVFIGIVTVMRVKPNIEIAPVVTTAAEVTHADNTRYDEPSIAAAPSSNTVTSISHRK